MAHTVFDFPIFFNPSWPWTHPPTSELFSEFWNFFISSRPLNVSVENVGLTVCWWEPEFSRRMLGGYWFAFPLVLSL